MSIRVTEDEVDKKMREIRERVRRGEPGMDRTALVGADPNKRYRWVTRNPRQQAHRKAQGYQLTKPKSGVEAPAGRIEEGGICLGPDVVLMETSRENYVERLATNKLKQERQERERTEQAREAINKLYRDEMRGKPHKDITFEDSN